MTFNTCSCRGLQYFGDTHAPIFTNIRQTPHHRFSFFNIHSYSSKYNNTPTYTKIRQHTQYSLVFSKKYPYSSKQTNIPCPTPIFSKKTKHFPNTPYFSTHTNILYSCVDWYSRTHISIKKKKKHFFPKRTNILQNTLIFSNKF